MYQKKHSVAQKSTVHKGTLGFGNINCISMELHVTIVTVELERTKKERLHKKGPETLRPLTDAVHVAMKI